MHRYSQSFAEKYRGVGWYLGQRRRSNNKKRQDIQGAGDTDHTKQNNRLRCCKDPLGVIALCLVFSVQHHHRKRIIIMLYVDQVLITHIIIFKLTHMHISVLCFHFC